MHISTQISVHLKISMHICRFLDTFTNLSTHLEILIHVHVRTRRLRYRFTTLHMFANITITGLLAFFLVDLIYIIWIYIYFNSSFLSKSTKQPGAFHLLASMLLDPLQPAVKVPIVQMVSLPLNYLSSSYQHHQPIIFSANGENLSCVLSSQTPKMF